MDGWTNRWMDGWMHAKMRIQESNEGREARNEETHEKTDYLWHV